jgi:hypothetical protein
MGMRTRNRLRRRSREGKRRHTSPAARHEPRPRGELPAPPVPRELPIARIEERKGRRGRKVEKQRREELRG